jgi:hypothetical protein
MKLYSSQSNGLRVEIDAQGTAMALFDRRSRNGITRAALEAAGNKWLIVWHPKRFTPYVTRQPFGYPKRPIGLATAKLRADDATPDLRSAWMRIKNREFFGWDPWGHQPPPRKLEEWWIDRNRSRYGIIRRTRFRLGGVIKLARKDIRRWAKKRTREYAGNLADDGMILPLVQSGQLRDKFSKQARAEATSTAKRSRLTIVMPRGDRQSSTVNRILTMLPYWEYDYIRRNFRAELIGGIANTFMSQAPTPTPAAPGIASGFLQQRAANSAAKAAARLAAKEARAFWRRYDRAIAKHEAIHD